MDSHNITRRISEELVDLRTAIMARDAEAIEMLTQKIGSALEELGTELASPPLVPKPELVRELRHSTFECGSVLRRAWRTVQALQSLYELFGSNECGTYRVRS